MSPLEVLILERVLATGKDGISSAQLAHRLRSHHDGYKTFTAAWRRLQDELDLLTSIGYGAGFNRYHIWLRVDDPAAAEQALDSSARLRLRGGALSRPSALAA